MLKDVLKKPIITEKTMNSGEYAFFVDKQASKTEIAKAIKKYFGVDTISVRTMIVKGKTRRAWRAKKQIRLEDQKKALIRVKEGQKIDLFDTQGEKK